MKSKKAIMREYNRLKVQYNIIQNNSKGRSQSHREGMASFEILTALTTLQYVFGLHDDVPMAYGFDNNDNRVYLKAEREAEVVEVEQC